MATKYLALLTNIGAAKLAKATALGTKVEITQLAVGDGNGVLPTPNPAQTALVHERRRAPLNMLTVDPANVSQIIAEQVIPEDVGGWWIREIGLFDKDGDMVAIANCAETYKPQLQEGSGRVQVIRVILIVSSTEAVTLKIDPAVVLATRQYVDSQLRAHEQSRNHPDASTTEKGFVQLSSSVTSDSESQAATPKAVKIAMDNANARLAKERNLSDLPNPALARQNLQLGDSSTKNTGTTANTVAAGDDARITGAMQKSQNGADIQDVAKFLQNLGLSDAFLIKEKYLPANLNLNTLGGEGKYGIYAQPVTNNATTENNYPTPEAGALLVTPAANNGMHVYITLSGHLWSRTSLDNKNTQWSQWVRQALKSELDDGLNLKFDSSSLSTAGRALVAKPTVSDMRAYLQLLSAAQRDVGTGANQIPDMNAFSGSIVSKGYQKLPGGLIIQWGINNASVGGTSGNGEDVSYAIPFPNGCLSLTATFDNGGPIIPAAAASIVDKVYFKLRCSEASGSFIFRWIALGF
ncbi:phage tail-collar fiber domain-containing protein [Citrobacter freundii]|uniref:phage tail-collar fiber domain-containing protein n=1 Tax=Citrobacter freundii TaxID=546 RepID=UPI002A36B49C|nr:phage tail protein [Citrobacter freundii]